MFLAYNSNSAGKPLKDLKFVIGGKLNKSKAQITADIKELGGLVVTKMEKKVAAVISTKGIVFLLLNPSNWLYNQLCLEVLCFLLSNF